MSADSGLHGSGCTAVKLQYRHLSSGWSLCFGTSLSCRVPEFGLQPEPECLHFNLTDLEPRSGDTSQVQVFNCSVDVPTISWEWLDGIYFMTHVRILMLPSSILDCFTSDIWVIWDQRGRMQDRLLLSNQGNKSLIGLLYSCGVGSLWELTSELLIMKYEEK